MIFSKLIAILNDKVNLHELSKGNVKFGTGVICGRIKILNLNGTITLGENYKINSGNGYNPIGGDTICRIISYGGNIRIGNRVGISNSTLVSRCSIVIEDDVFIGGSCKIYDNDFHPIDMESRVSFNQNIVQRPIQIKQGAFIGAHTIILKGSIIGEKSVIGAGSVVAGIIPDGEIWAGNPAHYIRKIYE